MTTIMYKVFLIIIFCTGLSLTPAKASKFHPFYVSVTEMTYNGKTKSIEISCKMFAEDLEDILKKNYKTAVDFSNSSQLNQNNNLLNEYITKHFSLNIDSRSVNFKFVGFEKDKESVYCYLEVLNIPAVKKVAINNSILFDYKEEQINIIHCIVNGNRQSTKLDNPKNQATFSF